MAGKLQKDRLQARLVGADIGDAAASRRCGVLNRFDLGHRVDNRAVTAVDGRLGCIEGSVTVNVIACLAVLVADLAHRAAGDDPALVHDDHAIADAFDVIEVMCAKNDGFVVITKLLGELQNGVGRQRVESACGFIVDQYVWVVHQRASDRNLAFHPLRHIAQPAVAVFEFKPVKRRLDPVVCNLAWHIVEIRKKAEIRAGGHILIQRRFLRQKAELVPHLGIAGVVTRNGCGPGGRLDEARKHFECRCLARAVGADDAKDLTAFDLKLAADDGGKIAVGLPQPRHLDHTLRGTAGHKNTRLPSAKQGVDRSDDGTRVVCGRVSKQTVSVVTTQPMG